MERLTHFVCNVFAREKGNLTSWMLNDAICLECPILSRSVLSGRSVLQTTMGFCDQKESARKVGWLSLTYRCMQVLLYTVHTLHAEYMYEWYLNNYSLLRSFDNFTCSLFRMIWRPVAPQKSKCVLGNPSIKSTGPCHTWISKLNLSVSTTRTTSRIGSWSFGFRYRVLQLSSLQSCGHYRGALLSQWKVAGIETRASWVQASNHEGKWQQDLSMKMKMLHDVARHAGHCLELSRIV